MPLTIPTSVDTIWTIAKTTQTTMEQIFTDNGIALPSNRFVSWHAPAWDCCDLLATYIANVKSHIGGSASNLRRAARLQGTVFEASIVSTYIACVPVMAMSGNTFPDPADLETSAHQFLRASWVMIQGITCYTDQINDTLVGCRIVKVSEMAPKQPQGGCAAATVTLTYEIS
jgi:hypothetical protein